MGKFKDTRRETLVCAEVFYVINSKQDYVEIDVFQYEKGIRVYAELCDDAPPFRDYCGFGESQSQFKEAFSLALADLNQQAYNDETVKIVKKKKNWLMQV